jgi:hypothetical protein
VGKTQALFSALSNLPELVATVAIPTYLQGVDYRRVATVGKTQALFSGYKPQVLTVGTVGWHRIHLANQAEEEIMIILTSPSAK